MRHAHHPAALALVLAGSLGMAGTACAGQAFTVAVKAIHKGEKFEMIHNDERTGRMVFFSQSRAVDRETKGKGLWNDSLRTATAHWDMTNGTGTGRGFARTEKGGGVVFVEWTGTCYGTGIVDGKPVTYCSGGWFVVPGSGTGPFAGLKGGGTWTGTNNAEGNFAEEWAGVMEQ